MADALCLHFHEPLEEKTNFECPQLGDHLFQEGSPLLRIDKGSRCLHVQPFDKPDVVCNTIYVCIKCNKKMLVNELSGHINHIKMH